MIRRFGSKSRPRSQTPWLSHLLLAACVLLAGATGCEDFVGVPAPSGSIYFPVGLALHPDGRYLYVVNSNFDVTFSEERGGTVVVVDTDTMTVIPGSAVLIGSFGGDVVLSPDARRLYVAVRGDNSVVRLEVSEDGRDIRCGNGRDGLACRIGGLPSDPFGLALVTFEANLEVGGPTLIELLVTTHLQSNDITAISIKDEDLATQERIRSELIAGGSAIAVHPRTGDFYAVGRFANQIRRFLPVIGREGDIAAIFPLGTIPLPNPSGTYDARDIVFTSDGDQAFVAARNPSVTLVLDTSPSNREFGTGTRDEVTAQIDLDGEPSALALVEEASGPALYVLEFGTDEIAVVDPVNRQVVGRNPVGDGPTDAVVDQTRHQRLYVSLFNENAIGVVDLDPDSRRYRQLVAKIR
jgi:DNA-binding beta-propeller fold protein YncE